ncbi:MAG: hypothetical protein GY898_09820 [Proteobacteria bacterium]|nr:hypothetical protein [Pseudomonadota bacterium]
MRLILAAAIVVAQVAVPALRPGEWVVESDQNGSIAGEVFDPVAGESAAGVVVRLSRPRVAQDRTWPEPWVPEYASGSEQLAAITTDREGRFLFRGLRPGRYRVRTAGVMRNTSSVDVIVRADALQGTARLEVEIGARVGGIVLDHLGQPLGNYPVRVVGFDVGDGLNSLPPDVRVVQRTANDGHFHLEALPTGTVYLQAVSRKRGYSPAMAVAVQSGEVAHDLTLVVPDEGDVLTAARESGGGIGVRLDFTPRGPVIKSLIGGMAAEEAGLQVGDLLTTLGSRSTRFMSPQEFVDRCRGPVSSSLVVHVERDGEIRELTLVRREFPAEDR